MDRYTEIALDRTRKLRFTIGDLRDLQRQCQGFSLLQIANKLGELDLEVIVRALWIGLRWESPKLTLVQANDLLQGQIDENRNLSEIIGPLVDAFMQGAGLVRAPADGQGDDAGKAVASPAAS